MGSRNYIIAAFVATLLVVSFDFSGRLLPESTEDTLANKQSGQAEKPSVTFLSSQQQTALNEVLGKYDVVKPEKNETNVRKAKKRKKKDRVKLLSREEQLAQAGALEGLFDGKNKYTLIATFNNDGEKFALIHRQHLISKKRAKFRVNLSEKVARYKVDKIEAKYIALVDGDRTVLLQLFKPNSTS